jgi:hypothetical protein
MFYVQEFDARPGITDKQMEDIYLRLAAGWSAVWPSNKFVGLFVRKFGLGPGPQFLAIWELPGFDAFDEWRADWPGFDEEMQALEDEFWGAAVNVKSRVMDRCAPA